MRISTPVRLGPRMKASRATRPVSRAPCSPSTRNTRHCWSERPCTRRLGRAWAITYLRACSSRRGRLRWAKDVVMGFRLVNMLNDWTVRRKRPLLPISTGGYSQPAMAKEKTSYVCTECGGASPRWLGKCTHCEAWNTLIETVPELSAPARNRFASLAKAAEVAALADIEASEIDRQPTGF